MRSVPPRVFIDPDNAAINEAIETLVIGVPVRGIETDSTGERLKVIVWLENDVALQFEFEEGDFKVTVPEVN